MRTTICLCNSKGFTLVEMVMILALLGLSTLLAATTFIGNMPKRRLNGATNQVAWDLMAARMQAISENNNVRVTFDSNNHEYVIWKDSDSDGVIDAGEEETKDIKNKYQDVTFSTTPTNNVTFQPKGTSTNTLTITLTNSTDSSNVTVGLTGRVQVN